MKEFVVRYVNGPLQGQGAIQVADDAPDEPPLLQRIPLPNAEQGLRRTVSDAVGGQSHAIYERSVFNTTADEWEFQFVRIE